MNFASENYDKVHPRILSALAKANKNFAPSYGKDNYTKETIASFSKILNRKDIDVIFCFNGTGANNFALSAITEKCSSILCSDVSHLYMAESTAPETFTGCRLYPLQSTDGKINPEDILSVLKKKDGLHFPSPSVVTISQPTESGTLYSIKNLKKISAICKKYRLLLHIDGARIFNALAALKCSFADFIKLSGVDAITIGGTKSGLMFGEAVVLINNNRFKSISCNHKRSMQLASKNRFIAVQFQELFKNEFWKSIGEYTNALARYFEQQMNRENAEIVYPVETNMVFVKMKPEIFSKLRSIANFYMWDDEQEIVRFAFSFSNTRKEIDAFMAKAKNILKEAKARA